MPSLGIQRSLSDLRNFATACNRLQSMRETFQLRLLAVALGRDILRKIIMRGTRHNFDGKTKRVIAFRSGYRCAHPECNGRTTIGPAKKIDASENTGVASHIYAAAKRGPRGHGNLSPQELCSAANGVWFCGTHARQVDENDGRDYPPPVLLSWKAAHEFKIAREHGAMLHPFGWIESLHIIDAPVFKSDQKITFSNVNVIVGNNGVGKTTICEWLSALKDSAFLARWGAYAKGPDRIYEDVRVSIDLRSPDQHQVAFHISDGRMTFWLDGQQAPFSPIGYEVVSLIREHRRNGHSVDDHVYIGRCLGIDEITAQGLADYISENPGIFLKGAEWRDEAEDDDAGAEIKRRLYCDLPDVKRPFQGLSSGETGAVLLDLAIARAKILSSFRPTLLMFDVGSFSMGEPFLSMFLGALSAPDTPFQSVVVTTELEDSTTWGGWQVIRLDRLGSLGAREKLTEVTVGDMHSALGHP